MARQIHIVVNCTDKKKLAVSEERRIRNLRRIVLEDRVADWGRRIEDPAAATLAAKNMYMGDHWQIARALPTLAVDRGWAADLWISSAGLGLVHSERSIPSYSATFSPGQPDSVASPQEGAAGTRTWWNLLAVKLSPVSSRPRSVTELVRGLERATVLIVGSPSYIDAMEDDLRKAKVALPSSSNLFLISSQPGPRQADLKSSWIPSNARFQGVLGGALTSLNVRLADYLLRHLDPREFDDSRVRAVIARLQDSAPPRRVYERRTLDDHALRGIITTRLRANSKLSHSRLLRILRDEGIACEQGRFRSLFGAVADGGLRA